MLGFSRARYVDTTGWPEGGRNLMFSIQDGRSPRFLFALCSHISFMVISTLSTRCSMKILPDLRSNGQSSLARSQLQFLRYLSKQNKNQGYQATTTRWFPCQRNSWEMLKSIWDYMANTPGSSPGKDLVIENGYQPRSQRLVYSISKDGGTVRLFTNQSQSAVSTRTDSLGVLIYLTCTYSQQLG